MAMEIVAMSVMTIMSSTREGRFDSCPFVCAGSIPATATN